MRYSTLPVCGMLVLGAIATLTASPTVAQLVPDTTLGAESSTVTPNAQVQGNVADLIGGGAVQGVNLFHSFLEFNVNPGQRVYFANPAGVEAIFSRVTGGSPSNIFGTLGVDGTADLFLMNPNGLVFGPGARLDVQGAFTATTASAIQFGTQGSFGAADVNPLPILTVDPSALWFNQLSQGAITSQGILFVDGGQSLILAGGNIVLDNSILDVNLSAGGRIELGAVSGEGTVQLAKDGNALNAFSLTFPESLARADITISNNSGIDVSASGGGSIAITGRDINISGSTVLAGIALGVGNEQSQAGDINIDAAETLRIESSSIIANQITPGGIGNAGNVNIIANDVLASQSNISATAFGPGDAGDINILVDRDIILNASNVFSLGIEDLAANAGYINIETTNLSLTNDAQISASAFGFGNTGNVVVNARDRVSLDGFATAIFSSIFGNSQAPGGDIQITARELSLTNSAKLDTSVNGQGSGGNVIINVQDGLIIDGTLPGRPGSSIFSTIEEEGTGTAGDVRINAGFVALTNSGAIQSLTRGQGNAGDISIQARDFVVLDGFANAGTTTIPGIDEPVFLIIPSAIASVVTDDENASGNGGNIYIQAGNYISLSNTARIQSSAESQTSVGNAGNIVLDTGSVLMDSASILATTLAEGNSGEITINARDLVTMVNRAQLQSSTNGVGNAGNISINTKGPITLNSDAGIFSTVGQNGEGSAGDIVISSDILEMTSGSRLTSRTLGQGNAGNVVIDSVGQILLDDAAIIAIVGDSTGRSFVGNGDGGTIQIRTNDLTLQNGGQLQASTFGNGDAGDIEIDAANTVSLDGDIPAGDNFFRSAFFSTVGFPGTGKGGNVAVRTRALSVTGGAVISTTTDGDGPAGNIRVEAHDRVVINGFSGRSGFPSALQTSTLSPLSGSGGDINLSVAQLEVLNGGQVLATSEGRSPAGTVRVNATNSILVSGSSPTLGSSIDRLPTPSAISVRSSAAGAAGNLIIGDLGNTPRLVLDGGQLIAESAAVDGGNIVIDLSQVLLLRNGSLISTTAGTAQAGGNGGNITIRAPFIVAIPNENSDIRADAFAGAGGNVSVTARGIFGIEPRLERSPLSDITATSALGVSGIVTLDTLDTSFIESSLTPLEDALVDTAALTSGSCIARTEPGLGAFTVTGGGGLPLSPGDGAISAYPTGTVRTVEESTASVIQEPDGVYQLPDGRLVLSRRCADRSVPSS